MKTMIRTLILTCIILIARPSSAIIGYVNRAFTVGDSLFVNPFKNSSNTLDTIFGYSTVPFGTVVSLWNPATMTFNSSSTFGLGGWSVNFTLNPGTGAKLTTSTLFTNTFIGEVLNHDGSLFTTNLTTPPVYLGPNGLFLLGDKTPLASTGNDIFLNILGRNPNIGEQVITLTSTSTYLGGGTWDNMPAMAVSDAAFLNVGPVPEPTTATIALLGFALIPIYRRRHL